MRASWEAFGFRLWCGPPAVMTEAHRHGEIELNLVVSGEVAYRFGARDLVLAPQQLLVFWATRPHRLVSCAPNTVFAVMTLPMDTFLRFGLPVAWRDGILGGEPHLADASPLDAALFRRWLADAPGEETRRILDLELEARLRRLALETASHEDTARRHTSAAARLAALIAERFHDPHLKLARLARDVGTHPNHAASVFRATFGTTMGAYLTQYRVAHAERLLLTTSRSILDVAAEAGFGSVSRFYAAFRRATGTSPGAYRASHGARPGRCSSRDASSAPPNQG